MVDLVLRPAAAVPDRPFALQLRWHESLGETEYQTLCHVSRPLADEIIRAGGAYWLLGKPREDAS